ncbi:MAG: hypothetical protein ABI053_08785, partial [Lacisediminihabitans sp.]
MVAIKRKKLDERGSVLEHQLDQTVGAMDLQDDLTSNLPDSLTIDVSLPATVHDAPEDELAVAIVEVPINPGVIIGGGAPVTTSIPVVPPVSAEPEEIVEEQVIPALPVTADSVYSRRDRLRGEVSLTPEPAAMLTADRLIDNRKTKRPRPEGGWNTFVYGASLHLVNLGDSPAVRAHKA